MTEEERKLVIESFEHFLSIFDTLRKRITTLEDKVKSLESLNYPMGGGLW